jgi:hypothetical protein
MIIYNEQPDTATARTIHFCLLGTQVFTSLSVLRRSLDEMSQHHLRRERRNAWLRSHTFSPAQIRLINAGTVLLHFEYQSVAFLSK